MTLSILRLHYKHIPEARVNGIFCASVSISRCSVQHLSSYSCLRNFFVAQTKNWRCHITLDPRATARQSRIAPRRGWSGECCGVKTPSLPCICNTDIHGDRIVASRSYNECSSHSKLTRSAFLDSLVPFLNSSVAYCADKVNYHWFISRQRQFSE